MVLTIVQVVAALAACVAVYYAFRGVRLAADTMNENRVARAADDAARIATSERDMVLRRLEQLEAISSQIIALREVAQKSVEPGSRPKDQTGTALVLTQLPILQSRLKVSLAILAELSGPRIEAAEELVNHPFNWGTESHIWLAGKAVDAIAEINTALSVESGLALSS